MKCFTTGVRILTLLCFAGSALNCAPQMDSDDPNAFQPRVYTNWEQFTVADGLPSDHIFAVEVDGDLVWIGTEGGLACYNKKTGKMRSWTEKDGLPWQVVSSLDANPKTGELWIGFFGGGLARFSGGRFDHFHQLNSGLVNDVVYGLTIENDNVWIATTAGASRYNTVTKQWSIYTEKNAPMEEIWNYGVHYDAGKIYIAVWGSGILEFDIASERWKHYLDPDGEMEIDLYRDDGLVHVITTDVSHVDSVMWVSTYFGMSRYDGRHWRGYYAGETGLPSDFGNGVAGRSANEAWFATDKGVAAVVDVQSDTWVTYTLDPGSRTGRAVVTRAGKVIRTVKTPTGIPHNCTQCVEFDGDDVWVGTSKGLGRAIAEGRKK
jgi:ligand-binding sensor domain-containing protein